MKGRKAEKKSATPISSKPKSKIIGPDGKEPLITTFITAPQSVNEKLDNKKKIRELTAEVKKLQQDIS